MFYEICQNMWKNIKYHLKLMFLIVNSYTFAYEWVWLDYIAFIFVFVCRFYLLASVQIQGVPKSICACSYGLKRALAIRRQPSISHDITIRYRIYRLLKRNSNFISYFCCSNHIILSDLQIELSISYNFLSHYIVTYFNLCYYKN